MLGVTSTIGAATSTTATFLGPLTTSFIAPKGCNTASIYLDFFGDFYQQAPLATDDGCLPSNWVVNGYYSPGVCPSGYTNACSNTQNNIETTICCPTQQPYTCALSMISDRFACSLYFSSTSTFYNLVVLLMMGSTSEVVPTYIGHDNTILAHSVQVRQVADPTTSLLHGGGDGDDQDDSDDGKDGGKSSIPADIPPIPSMSSASSSSDSYTTSSPSPSSLPTQTKSQSPSSYLSTQSRGVGVVTAVIPATETPPAQDNALSGSTIAGIVGGIVGAMILGAFGTFILMRRIKKRSSSRSSQHTSEKSRPADQPHVRTSINALPELDEQRNPSEMPPNKPMAWELQGSNNFTIWELPA